MIWYNINIKVINCPKLPRCSDTDREGFTGFATRALTEEPNRKVPAKRKGTQWTQVHIQWDKVWFHPRSQEVSPLSLKQVHGCRVWRSPICGASCSRRRAAFKARAAILAVFYCWNDPVNSPVDQDGADAFFSWSTELQTLNFRISSVSRVYKIFCLFS